MGRIFFKRINIFKFPLNIIFLLIGFLFFSSCLSKEIVLKEENNEKNKANYFDGLYTRAEKKEDKIKVLDYLKKTIHPETSIVLVRAFFDDDKEVVKKAQEVLQSFRRFTYDKQEKYFYDYLIEWWAQEPLLILKYMGYLEDYNEFIEEEKNLGREIWYYQENPLYYLVHKDLYKKEIVKLVYDDDPYALNEKKYILNIQNQNQNQENTIPSWIPDEEKQALQKLKKLNKEKEEKNLQDKIKSKVEKQMRYFWSIYLVGYFKEEDSLAILIQYLIISHLKEKENQKPLYLAYLKNWQKELKERKLNWNIQTFREKVQNQVDNKINYEWMSLLSVAVFQDKNWTLFLSHWLFDENTFIQELITAHLGAFYIKDYQNLLIEFYRNELIQDNVRCAILWSLGRIKKKSELFSILTSSKKDLLKNDKEDTFLEQWLIIQKLYWIRELSWVFPPKIVFDILLHLQKEEKIENFERLSLSLSLDILNNIDLLSLSQTYEDALLLKSNIIKLLIPYIEKNFYEHFFYLKSLMRTFYKYYDDKKETYNSLISYLKNLLDLEKQVLEKDLRIEEKIKILPKEWDKENRLNLQKEIFNFLIKKDLDETLKSFSFLLKESYIHENLQYEWIFYIEKNKKNEYFPKIYDFYKSSFQKKDDKKSKKSKESKNNLSSIKKDSIFPLSQLLITFSNLEEVINLLSSKKSDSYLKTESIKALENYLSQIKNWNSILDLYEDNSDQEFRFTLLEFVAKKKYKKAEDFIFQMAFSSKTKISYKKQAWRSLSYYDSSMFYLEEILKYSLSLKTIQDKIEILSALRFYKKYKDKMISFLREELKKNYSEEYNLLILIYLIELEQAKYSDFEFLFNIIDLKNKTQFDFVKKNYFQDLNLSEQKKWLEYLFNKSPKPFHAHFKDFFFPLLLKE